MRTAGQKRAVRNALFLLGLHATTQGVVHALRQQGIRVEKGSSIRGLRLRVDPKDRVGVVPAGGKRP
jgi:hypothetical protein